MNSKVGSGFFLKMLVGFLSVTLSGLDKMFKLRYVWKDLSLRNLLSISLGYQSCRGVLHCSVLSDKLCLAHGVIDTKSSFSNLLKASHLTPSISHL